MNPTLKKVLTHLTFYVAIAILAGILLGHYAPATAIKTEFLAKWFINIIKVFIGPIIFLTIVLGIGSMGNLKKVGRIGLKSLIYFEVVTTLSLGLGIAVALILQPGSIDKSKLSVQDPSKFTSKAGEPFSWLHFLQSNLTLQILIAAIAVGVIVSYLKQREQIIALLEKLSKIVFKTLKYVMYLAPLGAFGGMAFAVGKFGLATLIPLAKLMGCMYVTMALFIFLVLGGIMRYFKLSIVKFLSYIREEILVVLGTSSSETAMPGLMYKLEKMGCAKSVVGLVVPTGYSFNLDGTSIYLSMAAIFLAQLYDVHLSMYELATLLGILMLTSKGAAGVTGSGFVVLASTLAYLHTIPPEGLAFLLGVDKFMSEARAITNIIGNGVATLVIAKSEGEYIPQPAGEIEAYV
ncbi:MAG: cation:dicarboxylase symporter family transporter [Bacteroidota bacterium]